LKLTEPHGGCEIEDHDEFFPILKAMFAATCLISRHAKESVRLASRAYDVAALSGGGGGGGGGGGSLLLPFMRSHGSDSNVASTSTTQDVANSVASNAFPRSSSSSSSSSSPSSLPQLAASIRLPVYAFDSLDSPASTIDLPADIFAQPLRTDILHRVVRWQLARRQQGTHKTKTRSEVRGGGRKPWQQKGSGRARQGTIRAVQWRGGGVVHGPVVRSHAHDLPKKVRRLGLAVAVSAKVEEGRLVVIDRLQGNDNDKDEDKDEEIGKDGDKDRDKDKDEGSGSHKTQAMLKRLDGLLGRAEVPVTRRSVLLVDGGASSLASSAVGKATRNIPWVDVIPVVGLNVYSILQRDVLVMTKEAVELLVARLHTPIKR